MGKEKAVVPSESLAGFRAAIERTAFWDRNSEIDPQVNGTNRKMRVSLMSAVTSSNPNKSYCLLHAKERRI